MRGSRVRPLGQQRVVEQVDLAYGEVVGRPPVAVQCPGLGVDQRACLRRLIWLPGPFSCWDALARPIQPRRCGAGQSHWSRRRRNSPGLNRRQRVRRGTAGASHTLEATEHSKGSRRKCRVCPAHRGCCSCGEVTEASAELTSLMPAINRPPLTLPDDPGPDQAGSDEPVPDAAGLDEAEPDEYATCTGRAGSLPRCSPQPPG
jgi:hypothetical protein